MFLGRRLEYTYEVKEMVAESGGTRMLLRNRGNPAGLLRLIAPVMAAAMRRANRKGLTRLKAILERPEQE